MSFRRIVALVAVEGILKLGKKHIRDYAILVNECDGVDEFDNFQTHESKEVYEKAVSLIETHFGAEDKIDDDNIAPESNCDTFAFGVKACKNAAHHVAFKRSARRSSRQRRKWPR